jgi:hypothetical protein
MKGNHNRNIHFLKNKGEGESRHKKNQTGKRHSQAVKCTRRIKLGLKETKCTRGTHRLLSQVRILKEPKCIRGTYRLLSA